MRYIAILHPPREAAMVEHSKPLERWATLLPRTQGYCRYGGRRGAAIVEFAFVAPVVFLFVFGLIELSRGLMVTHLLNNAARNGCRVGILEGKGNTDITNEVNTTLAAAGVSSQTVTVLVNDGNGDPLNAKLGDEVTVSLKVPVASVSWLPGAQYLSGNLSGKYTLRKE